MCCVQARVWSDGLYRFPYNEPHRDTWLEMLMAGMDLEED